MTFFKQSSELCDVVSLLAVCPDDNTYMLILDNINSDYWIPSTKITNPSQSWDHTVVKDTQDIFGLNAADCILRFYKVWAPRISNALFLNHCVYKISVDANTKNKTKNTMGKYRGKIRWNSEQDIIKLWNSYALKSPEILEYMSLATDSKFVSYVLPQEIFVTSNFVEITDEAIVSGKQTNYQQLVEASGLDKLAQEQVLKEFLGMCFPAIFMSLKAFTNFIPNMGWTKDVAPFLFRTVPKPSGACALATFCTAGAPVCSRTVLYESLATLTSKNPCGVPNMAPHTEQPKIVEGEALNSSPYFFKRSADINNRNGLSFRDFLYFLAAVDPNTTHGGTAAELRCRYMFKYYDRDKDNSLKLDEFKLMITDLRKSKKQPVDAPNVAKETAETYKAMGVKDGQNLNINDFLKAICDLKIRGTSHVFRSTVSVIKYIKELGERESTSGQPEGKGSISKSAQVRAKTASQIISGIGPENLRSKLTVNPDYEVAYHTVKIQRSGQAINIDEMRQVHEAVSLTTMKQPVNEQSKRISLDLFSQRSVSNELLKGLRYLTSINNTKDAKTSYSWGQLDPVTYARNLIIVCNQVREVLRSEPRLLALTSPVYIMGDLHGNVADLLYFEKVLWHIGPGLSPCNLLFLGDYVDRGAYSIEVISYLFAYKLQTPNKVSLLRGNHEIREVQKMFTFYKECILKLGEKLGNEVWTAMNNAFDCMPIAAVVDGKIFCCHGGVPPPWLCPVISAINDIPVPLNQPDVQSSLAWELMWNDPVRPKTVNDKLAMELLANEGFAVNARRGTAHIFSVEALERFLKANQLTHIVRAHEVAQAGFNVQQKGKLLTVFSSSKYCGGQNDAACIMADQGKLRVLRLETD